MSRQDVLPPSTTPEPLCVDIRTAAAMLGISRDFAYRCAHNGTLPVFQLGDRLLVDRVGLETLISGRSGNSPDGL